MEGCRKAVEREEGGIGGGKDVASFVALGRNAMKKGGKKRRKE